MNRILSLIVTILFALCIEAGIFMLIAHWWGMTAAWHDAERYDGADGKCEDRKSVV